MIKKRNDVKKSILIVIVALLISVIAGIGISINTMQTSGEKQISAESIGKISENETNILNAVVEVNNTIETTTTQSTKTNTTTTDNPTKSDGVKSSTNNNNKGVIYLTFDDGPTTDITPKILDILKEQNVKATFFILNYDSTREKLIKREYEEGHSIGIHGYSHTYSEIYKTEQTYLDNLYKLQEKIKDSIGITTWITRFPGGSSNTVSKKYNYGIMTKLVKTVEEKGFKYYDWSVSSGDAGGAKTKEKVYNNVTKGLSKNRSNVVLMHDFSGNTKTLNALKDIIQYGKKNGYTFKAITYEDSMVCHHGVNN